MKTLRVTVGYQVSNCEPRTVDLTVDEAAYNLAIREGRVSALLQGMLPPGAVLQGFTVGPDQ